MIFVTTGSPSPPDTPRGATRPSIEAFRPGDEMAILGCLLASFGVEGRLERWRHLHLESPDGPSLIVVAREADTLVGQIASLPRTVRFFGAECTVGHVIDTMVHPRWQGRGLFQELAAASEKMSTEAGLAASYGVANDIARHSASKYEQRRSLGPFPVLVRPLRQLASLGAMVRRSVNAIGGRAFDRIPECAAAGPAANPFDGGRLVDVVANLWTPPSFDARHSRLFADAEGLRPIAFARDADHLRWRYPNDSAALYVQRDSLVDDEVAATAVVRLVSLLGLRLLFVMEWHWRKGATAAGQRLVRDILELARKADAHGVAVMAARGTPHRGILQRRGFLAVPSPLFPKGAWPGVRPRGRHADDARWFTPTNWYSTWGDGLVI